MKNRKPCTHPPNCDFCNWCGFDKRNKLFITDDGVNIFKDDTYYYVSKDFKIIKTDKWFSKENDITAGCRGNFSTFEKAEQFVSINKPVLSIKQLYNLVINLK